MQFDELLHFVEQDMRMSHVYQPVMIRELLNRGGRATREDIARALLNEDRSELDYYGEITRDMVGRVLTHRGVTRRVDADYELAGYEQLTDQQVTALRDACERRLAQYVAKRGDAIWEHRRGASGYISGTLRYEVLKNAKFRCELCGVSADERALEVDHITPHSKGGPDDLSNLQALCFSCNSMKGDRDNTDFRAVRAAYEHREPGCPFCSKDELSILFEDRLAFVIEDRHPVARGHVLVIPKRHTAEYFDLGAAESGACQRLLAEARKLIMEKHPEVAGFNVGMNSGSVAGQTVMHCHLHLIPRREGDSPNPRGGVRGVIPGKADYTPT